MTLYNVFLEFILPDMVLHNLLMEEIGFDDDSDSDDLGYDDL